MGCALVDVEYVLDIDQGGEIHIDSRKVPVSSFVCVCVPTHRLSEGACVWVLIGPCEAGCWPRVHWCLEVVRA